MPSIENFTIQAGDDITLKFDVSPDEGVSLAGSTIRWWAARSAYSKPDKINIMKSSAVGDGITIDDPDALTFSVALDREDTLNLIGDFYHEAKVTDPAGNFVTVTKGTMTIERTVVRVGGET